MRTANGPADVIVLANHGVIVTGDDLEEISARIDDVEERLMLPIGLEANDLPAENVDEIWQRLPKLESLATEPELLCRASSGTYYPDHVVFLGPALPVVSADSFPAALAELPVPTVIVEGQEVYIKRDATPAHHAMLQCVFDVLVRVPAGWELVPIGREAEADLLDWDAENIDKRWRRSEAATA